MSERRRDCHCGDSESPGCVTVNADKDLWFCHVCKKGGPLDDCGDPRDPGDTGRAVEELPDPPDSGGDDDSLGDSDGSVLHHPRLGEAITDFIAERVLPDVDVEPSPDHSDYMRIWSFGRTGWQDRAMGGQAPRYRTPKGKRDLFWVTKTPPRGAPVWVVEGPFDAYALHAAGARYVAALMGSQMSPGQAYELRRNTVLVCMDADAAGYSAARKEVKKALTDMEVPYVLTDLPDEHGKDPNDVWVQDPDVLRNFIEKQEGRIAPNENEYVGRLFKGGQEPLLEIPTPVDKLNQFLRGGWKTGVHLLAGVPGAGKTCLAVRCAVHAAQAGFRVLFVSQEISKRQMWARIGSTLPEAPSWEQLEKQPESMPESNVPLLVRLSEKIHVRTGWTVERIEQVIDNYDFVVLDYIQRLPDAMGASEDAARTNISNAGKRLSNLARDSNKNILVISSMPRSAYGKSGSPPTTLDIFKESGDLEYVAQTASSIFGTEKRLNFHLIKNTRGVNDRGLVLEPDLAHCSFPEPGIRTTLPGAA